MTATTRTLNTTLHRCSYYETVLKAIDVEETEETVTDEEDEMSSSCSSDCSSEPNPPNAALRATKRLSFGVPVQPDTTIVALDEDADETTPQGFRRGGGGDRRRSSTSLVSFKEEVILNHVDDFRTTLTKAECQSIWYSELEMRIIQMKSYEEQHAQKLREQRQHANKLRYERRRERESFIQQQQEQDEEQQTQQLQPEQQQRDANDDGVNDIPRQIEVHELNPEEENGNKCANIADDNADTLPVACRKERHGYGLTKFTKKVKIVTQRLTSLRFQNIKSSHSLQRKHRSNFFD